MEKYFLAVILIFLYLLIVKKLTKDKWWFLSIFFLIITPWFIQLLLSGFEFWWFKPIITRADKFIESFLLNFSTDYLFFKGDPRVKFGTQETGLFYIFQIPLIILGFYDLFQQKEKYRKIRKILLVWLFLGFLLASFFLAPDFSNGLLYFLPLQLISFLGFLFIFKNWKNKKILQKILISLFLLFSIYEITVFFHVLVVHYPKRLMSL